jgi:hypothetical protein
MAARLRCNYEHRMQGIFTHIIGSPSPIHEQRVQETSLEVEHWFAQLHKPHDEFANNTARSPLSYLPGLL